MLIPALAHAQRVPHVPVPKKGPGGGQAPVYTSTVTLSCGPTAKQFSSVSISGTLMVNGQPDLTAVMKTAWIFPTGTWNKNSPIGTYFVNHGPIGAAITDPTLITVNVWFIKGGQVVSMKTVTFKRIP
ncbi:hypothetical protein [Sphingomonas sp.]|uniref:hypothetical protein n=1 Tax=Sphingomonas sp. TaxID=28214 RepID=UPI0025E22177|nr:hypothetical protein [Sphingomonas sp.]